MKSALCIAIVIVLIGLTGNVSAQFTQDPNDLGAADTVEIVFPVIPDATTGQLQLQLDLYFFNDIDPLAAVTMGFGWDNPNVQMDSAVATPEASAGWDLGTFLFETANIAVTNANQRFIFGGSKLFESGLPPTPTRKKVASYYFTLSSWSSSDVIKFDTLEFSTGSIFKFVLPGQLSFIPYWTGGQTIRDTAAPVESNLLLSTDSLHFDAVAEGSNPSSQSFQISSDNLPIGFTVGESISWLSVNPFGGVTPQTISVLPNISGLVPGEYLGYINVASGTASNSPLTVAVSMTVTEPPPVIAVSPAAFFFNAVAGEANPASKTMTITNVGGSILDWSVSSLDSWLTLAPGFGTDSGDVTLSVDITGLPFGEYDDTILITAVGAANDPVEVPVHLSVGSDLPIIQVDSAFNMIIAEIPLSTPFLPSRFLGIYNGGAGTMSYWIEESSSNIISVSPDSGSAPGSVEVGFKIAGSPTGDEFDTLWVYSNEAINSPFPVVFQFHFVTDPAEMHIVGGSVSLDMFECSQGVHGLPSSALVGLSNIGGDNPLNFQLTYESEYFTVETVSSQAPATIEITAIEQTLPLGSYLDTIMVSSVYAINSPQYIYVSYNIIEGEQTPSIWVSNPGVIITAQEENIPATAVSQSIRNRFGGCMPWEISEDIPWLIATPLSGEVPGEISLNASAVGYTMGEYRDSVFVTSTTAGNSPYRILVYFRVWRFRGDWDYSAEVNILDLVANIDWLFNDGAGPIPEYFVGDVNCDHLVDITDLTYFVDWLFGSGPPPCGNP